MPSSGLQYVMFGGGDDDSNNDDEIEVEGKPPSQDDSDETPNLDDSNKGKLEKQISV